MVQATEWPEAQYTLTQKAYAPLQPGGPAQLLERGTVITHDGKPGPHMTPMCEKGREAHRLAGEQTLDPLRRLPLNGVSDTDLIDALQSAKALQQVIESRIDQALGNAGVKLPGNRQAAAVPTSAPPPPAAQSAAPTPPPPPAPAPRR